jgi:hypothetical protein
VWLVKRSSGVRLSSEGFENGKELDERCKKQRDTCKSFARQDEKVIDRLTESVDGLHKKFDEFKSDHQKQHRLEQQELSRSQERIQALYLENIERVTAKSIERIEAIKKAV